MSRILQVSRATAVSIAASAQVQITTPTLADILIPLGGRTITIVEAAITVTAADASVALQLRYLTMVHLWADASGAPINIGSVPSNIRLPVDSQWNDVAAGIPMSNTLFFGASLLRPVEADPSDIIGTAQPTQLGLRGVVGVVNTDGAAAHTATITLTGLFDLV